MPFLHFQRQVSVPGALRGPVPVARRKPPPASPLWQRIATGSALRSPARSPSDANAAKQAPLGGSATASDIAATGLSGPGRPLPWRSQFERSFGADLGQLRVHGGPEAQAACEHLDAAAYTRNDHIAVRDDPPPWLLAHEVAHSVQQSRWGIDHGSAGVGDAEADANKAASAAVAGQHASVRAAAAPGIPQCFKLDPATQKAYPKAANYLRDGMPKVVNDEPLLKALVAGARIAEDKVRAGIPWDTGPTVTPKNLRGTRAGRFETHQGSQELEIHKGELDKWEAETDPSLNEAYAFWLETVVLHEYVHFLGDNREKADEEWGQDFEQQAYGNLLATRDAAWNLEHFLRARFSDGDYEVKVTGKEAAFKQRFQVLGADVGNGTHEGVVGKTVSVSKTFDPKAHWQILVEHDDGKGGWQPSRIHVVFTSIGSEWLIRTEDWTDRDFNDLEITVKRTAYAKPPAVKTP